LALKGYLCYLKNLLRNTKQSLEDEIDRIVSERERLRRELEESREQVVTSLLQEKDEILNKHDKEKELLNHNLSNLAADRDALLLAAENEKQKVK
jgi:hypothetical protein